MTEQSAENLQADLREFVDREVIYSVSYLIPELISKADEFPDEQDDLYALASSKDYEEGATDAGWEEAGPYWVFDGDGVKLLPSGSFSEEDAWVKICELEQIALVDEDGEQIDPQEAAEDEGWSLLEDVTFIDPENGETSEAGDWEELCEEQDIEPYEREAYEFIIVSDWLGAKLTQYGETVRNVFNMTVWGRCTTGQSIILDGVIEEIYRSVWPDRFDETGAYKGKG